MYGRKDLVKITAKVRKGTHEYVQYREVEKERDRRGKRERERG